MKHIGHMAERVRLRDNIEFAATVIDRLVPAFFPTLSEQGLGARTHLPPARHTLHDRVDLRGVDESACGMDTRVCDNKGCAGYDPRS